MGGLVKAEFGKSGNKEFASQGELDNFLLTERSQWIAFLNTINIRNFVKNDNVIRNLQQSNIPEIHALFKGNILFLTETAYWREMRREGFSGPMGGQNKVVEVDETYVGGKAKNRAHREPAPKKAVVALVERDGAVKSFHVANVTGATLRPIIVKHVSRKSMLMTDEAPVYTKIGQEFANHGTVNHSAGEYTRKGHFYHSNTVENFFSIFKRGVIGTYHHLSEAHIGRYCAEFDFRYNTRKENDVVRTEIALRGIAGKRLTYRRAGEAAHA